jgi:hypothetical protein
LRGDVNRNVPAWRPEREVELIAGTPAGGGQDRPARVLIELLKGAVDRGQKREGPRDAEVSCSSRAPSRTPARRSNSAPMSATRSRSGQKVVRDFGAQVE